MTLPRRPNPLPGMTALIVFSFAALPGHAQTLTLNSGDSATVTGTGTIGTVNSTPIDNSTSSYASPSHGIFGPGGDVVTLNGTAVFALGSGGALTPTSRNDYGIYADGSGSVTVSGGTITNGTLYTCGIYADGSSPITVSGGTISLSSSYNIGISAVGTGPVLFSGGDVSVGGGGTRLKSGSSPVTVSGGTITSLMYGAVTGSGPVTISGGTITGAGEKMPFDAGLTTGTGSVTISGGTITSDGIGVMASGPVTVTGGVINGQEYGLETGSGPVTILGGTITGGLDAVLANSGGSVLITSGNIQGSGAVSTAVFAGSGSTVTISGGNISGGMYHAGQAGAGLEANGGTINLFSLDDTPFLVDGVPMNNTTLGQYTSGTDTITGTLMNGSLLNLTFEDIGGTINLNVGSPPAIPEASTTVSFGLLLVLGMGSLLIARKKKAAPSA